MRQRKYEGIELCRILQDMNIILILIFFSTLSQCSDRSLYLIGECRAVWLGLDILNRLKAEFEGGIVKKDTVVKMRK